jgi:hypothetical protein
MLLSTRWQGEQIFWSAAGPARLAREADHPGMGNVQSLRVRPSLLCALTLLAGCSSNANNSPGGPTDMNLAPGSGAMSSGGAYTQPPPGSGGSTGVTSPPPVTGAGSSGFQTPGAGGTQVGPGSTFTPPPSMGGFGNPPPTTGVGGSLPTGGVPNIGGSSPGGAPPGTGGAQVSVPNGCAGETLPPVTGDYAANGPMPSMVVNNTGPDGMYTIYRPATLGANGFKHPVATWGNGITTTPAYYPGLLGAVASHGFVVIASNSTSVTAQMMTDGLDWMIMQGGEYAGKLNTTCLVTIGYSLGGGASVTAGAHANVVATASMHGVTGASNALHAPLLLLTSETDTFVVPATFVTPTFQLSAVQTFYGTLSKAADTGNAGHLIPVDILPSAANMDERAAVIAWLRLWVYSDQGAKKYFYGDDCILCKDPWTMPQRKMWQ